MTLDEARQLVIDGMNYAAYRETESSLHDSDKNRLFGSEHYTSGRPVYTPLAYPVASGRHQPLWCWLRRRPRYPVLLKQPDKQKSTQYKRAPLVE